MRDQISGAPNQTRHAELLRVAADWAMFVALRVEASSFQAFVAEFGYRNDDAAAVYELAERLVDEAQRFSA